MKRGEHRFRGKVVGLAPLVVLVDAMDGHVAKQPYRLELAGVDADRVSGRLELEGRGLGWSGVVGGWKMRLGDVVTFVGRRDGRDWSVWWRSVEISYGERLYPSWIVEAAEGHQDRQEGLLLAG